MSANLLLIVLLTLSFVIIISAVILSIHTGQGGSHLEMSTSKDRNTIDRDDDRYWKLGLFFFNKNDPTLFLEKRFGIGLSINWARPLAWLSLTVIIILAILIPIVLT